MSADQTKPKKYKAPPCNRRLFDDAAGETAESPETAPGVRTGASGLWACVAGLWASVVWLFCAVFMLSPEEQERRKQPGDGVYLGKMCVRGFLLVWFFSAPFSNSGGNAQARQPMDEGVPEEKHGG